MKAIKQSNEKIKCTEPFKNLFTQGMVCHETYKDQNGSWLYPDEIEKVDSKKTIKKSDKSLVIVGPSESMSKSKKNTINPETMIKEYGADAVRWFILSDSPPEKDVQWSNTGVNSSNKFLQKIWNLNQSIINRKETEVNKKDESNFIDKINLYVNRIDENISNFQFNVAIAQFYEMYKCFNEAITLKVSNKTLTRNIIKIMKLMIPFTPHLAYECLLNLNSTENNKWPNLDEYLLKNIKINFVVQINGKTRDVLSVKKDLKEKEINNIIKNESKANKYILDKKILKTIFVRNKIINYIIKN